VSGQPPVDPARLSSRALVQAYEQLINRHDFDLLAGLIASDAVFWFSDGSHRGLAAIRVAFEATWASLGNETYWLDRLDWLTESDTAAACIYCFNWRAEQGGRPISGTGRGTTVLRRAELGWQIVHEHLSGPGR